MLYMGPEAQAQIQATREALQALIKKEDQKP